ncbi:protein translocase subunit secE/sec61 gamma [Humidesulfovibrio mexicanus]|jgi:preprotein translocase subunit SecE|uniref:Protein translocase subunit SecE n=1 Tax=Humidesulfovibrio mexicanus TaxID=147047 RepID=A0A238Y4I9_9BACT|nr:preprotein translocase subunit SecE [Humidesulfovibrio mexicanus]SNR65950.1 protein translocase subunit secE/sec61 gamma [Humidesulfovibrio mexicanus]
MAKNTAKGSGGQQGGETPETTSGVASKAQELKVFFEEAQVELKKVTWPSRKETVTTCAAVMILVAVMSLFLGLVDLGLSKAVEIVLS